MNANEYQKLAMRTLNPELLWQEQLTNAALGLAGEAGEVADLVKKYTFHGHNLDEMKVVDELGDILWYITQAAHSLGVTLDAVMRLNINKLEARYPEGFSAERSIHRDGSKDGL